MSNHSLLKDILLDLRGRYKLVCNLATETTVKVFDWGNAIVDALIFSGIGAFTTYASSLTIGVSPLNAVHTAVVTFGLQFLTYLGIKRGLVKEKE